MELILVHHWKKYHTQDNFSIDVISELEKNKFIGIQKVTFRANNFMMWMDKEGLLNDILPPHKFAYITTIGLKEYPVIFKQDDGLNLNYMNNDYYLSPFKTYILRGGRVYAPEYITFYRQEKPYYSYIKFDYNSEVDPL